MICDLFCYGTLMQGECRHPALERGGIVEIAPGRVRGRIVHLESYPGLLDGESWVRGECMRFERMDDLLASLDRVEGPEYRREPIEVLLDNGETRTAWVYRLIHEPPTARPIPSGDWRNR